MWIYQRPRVLLTRNLHCGTLRFLKIIKGSCMITDVTSSHAHSRYSTRIYINRVLHVLNRSKYKCSGSLFRMAEDADFHDLVKALFFFCRCRCRLITSPATAQMVEVIAQPILSCSGTTKA
jgi:hypothetical protein